MTDSLLEKLIARAPGITQSPPRGVGTLAENSWWAARLALAEALGLTDYKVASKPTRFLGISLNNNPQERRILESFILCQSSAEANMLTSMTTSIDL